LKAKAQLERATEKVGRARRRQLLPDQKELEKISRYEAHLDRSFYKALHELQRLQDARRGVIVPPPVAVDVTGMPDQEN